MPNSLSQVTWTVVPRAALVTVLPLSLTLKVGAEDLQTAAGNCRDVDAAGGRVDGHAVRARSRRRWARPDAPVFPMSAPSITETVGAVADVGHVDAIGDRVDGHAVRIAPDGDGEPTSRP